MSENEANAYILGTHLTELQRLGTQHQVWAGETVRGWDAAGFTAGQTILDLGCGPGFCSTELAYIVGPTGSVIAVDRSEAFISFLEKVREHHGLNISTQCADFDDMKLDEESLDGVYCRWALAWVPNPADVIEKVSAALRPGGAIVAHEYFDWSTFQTEPRKPALAKAIAAALKTFKDQPGEIDIGRELPGMFARSGFDVVGTRPISKMARPDEFTWSWPRVFIQTYVAGLVSEGLLSSQTMDEALRELAELESDPRSMILAPTVIEVIARKR